MLRLFENNNIKYYNNMKGKTPAINWKLDRKVPNTVSINKDVLLPARYEIPFTNW